MKFSKLVTKFALCAAALTVAVGAGVSLCGNDFIASYGAVEGALRHVAVGIGTAAGIGFGVAALGFGGAVADGFLGKVVPRSWVEGMMVGVAAGFLLGGAAGFVLTTDCMKQDFGSKKNEQTLSSRPIEKPLALAQGRAPRIG